MYCKITMHWVEKEIVNIENMRFESISELNSIIDSVSGIFPYGLFDEKNDTREVISKLTTPIEKSEIHDYKNGDPFNEIQVYRKLEGKPFQLVIHLNRDPVSSFSSDLKDLF